MEPIHTWESAELQEPMVRRLYWLGFSLSALWVQVPSEGSMWTYLSGTRAENITASFWKVLWQVGVLVLTTNRLGWNLRLWSWMGSIWTCHPFTHKIHSQSTYLPGLASINCVAQILVQEALGSPFTFIWNFIQFLISSLQRLRKHWDSFHTNAFLIFRVYIKLGFI